MKIWQAMKKAGCPQNQAELFDDGGYTPLPWSLGFHAAAREADKEDGPDEILAGGARGPGKSHMELAQVGIDDCQRAAGLKVLFLRKIKHVAQESLDDLVRRVFGGLQYEYTAGIGRVKFTNDSRILIGGYKDEADIEKYIGIEFDELVIEELNQLRYERVLKLRGSVRSSRRDWRVRAYYSANPGGIGHNDVKDRFILPWRSGQQQYTRFFPGTYKDNPFLSKDYIRYLESLPGALGKAWREGDWDAFEGMAFPNWDYDLHVCKPFEIPAHWLRWTATDEGYTAPWCTLWFAMDPATRIIYVYREAYETQLTPRQQAQRIKDLEPDGEKIGYRLGDPAMFAKKTADDTVTSTADTYRDLGIVLEPADNHRINGKRKIDDLLALREDGKPGLMIFENCVNLIRTLPALPLDEVYVEDVDTDAEDHAYDTLRYGCSRVHTSLEVKEKTAMEKRRERNQQGDWAAVWKNL